MYNIYAAQETHLTEQVLKTSFCCWLRLVQQ